MLAGVLDDPLALEYPVFASPKLDGIRCIKRDGKILSRKFKPIPNKFVRSVLEDSVIPDGFDGELIVIGKSFNDIQSLIMSEDGEPEFSYYVFDFVGRATKLDTTYRDRIAVLRTVFRTYLKSEYYKKYLVLLDYVTIKNQKELFEYEYLCLGLGHEGVMLRSPDGPYKCGRSTCKEGFLLKLKQFKDAEGIVVGFEERLHNANPAKKDAFGRSKRSSHKANLIGRGDLGALVIHYHDQEGLKEFVLGTGFDDQQRKEIWNNRDKYLNKTIKFKYQESGKKDLPRFPVFLGFRHEDDM